MKTIRLKTDGTYEVISASNNSYSEVEKLLGAYPEYVHPIRWKGIVLVVDEIGLTKGLNMNPIASYLYGTDQHNHPIVGDVILMKDIMTSNGPDYSFFYDFEIDRLNKFLKKLRME